MFIDTHCHIYKEYYEDIDEIIKVIKDANIKTIINNGCDSKSNLEVLDLISKYDMMYGAIGIHPEVVDNYKDKDIEFIIKHLKDKKIIAIGEIGLDYHYTKENKDEQIKLFERQLQIAEDYNMPVIIHSRDATLDTINTLKKYKVKGIIHSFSGSYETACEYIKMGFYLGVNGVMTYKNSNIKDIYKKIDLKNIVFETDSPYLTPVPFRGKQNNPSHINDIALFVSELHNISLEELAKITNKNVELIFDI